MLPRHRRVRRPAEFRAVVSSGARAACSSVVVHVHATGSARPARAGFVVGRSIGPAVVRHHVTRQLRHLMAGHLDALPPGTDVVIRALPPAAQASGPQLGRDVSSALRRASSKLGQDTGTRPAVSR